METGEVIYEKVYASPRPPPTIPLKHDWMMELGSEVVRQAEVNQPTCNALRIVQFTVGECRLATEMTVHDVCVCVCVLGAPTRVDAS